MMPTANNSIEVDKATEAGKLGRSRWATTSKSGEESKHSDDITARRRRVIDLIATNCNSSIARALKADTDTAADKEIGMSRTAVKTAMARRVLPSAADQSVSRLRTSVRLSERRPRGSQSTAASLSTSRVFNACSPPHQDP